jgi:hypothetical protein
MVDAVKVLLPLVIIMQGRFSAVALLHKLL